MCYQLVEVYTACRCFYYQHAVDRCAGYGRSGHGIERRTISVGYSCSAHSSLNYAGPSPVTGNSKKANKLRQPRATERPQPSPVEESQHRRVKVSHNLSPFKAAEHFSPVENFVPDEKQDTNDIDNFADIANLTDSSAEESDPETAVNDSFSDVSLPSGTGITWPDQGIEEELFHRLLQYGNLQYLWPQVVELSGNRACQEIRRLLRRFGDDLTRIAEGKREKQAGGFVRKHATEVATRIWEAHRGMMPTEAGDDKSSTPKDTVALEDEEAVHKLDEVELMEEPVDYRLLHDFLFETEPVVNLERSVRAWVLLAQPPISRPLAQIVGSAVRSRVGWMAVTLGQKANLEKSAKLEHKCRCGEVISDNYVELKPGALETLKSQLQGREGPLEAPEVEESIEGNGNKTPQKPKSLREMWKAIQLFDRRPRGKNLPLHHSSRGTSDLYGCPKVPGPLVGTHNFVLLCLPFMRWATKLRQAEVCRLQSDQDFFRLLNSTYAGARDKLSWAKLRRVSAIEFVRFEMFQNDLVDIQQKPSLPTVERRADYEFEPLADDAATMPPIGPNLLMHYFEHPDHADVVPVLFRRVPKKLRGKLAACPVKRSSVGWGMQLAEGVSAWLLFWCGCAAFGAALAVAVGWSVVRGDVQGGFAIAGFLVAFLLFCVGAGNVGPSW